MPARVVKIRHDENTRLKIKVSHLINRMQRFFDGEITLSSAQVNAGRILLDRALPVLQSVEVSGEVSMPNVIRAPEIASTVDDWEKNHTPIQRTDH